MRDATGRDALRSLVGISKSDRVVIVARHPVLFSNHGEAISLFSERSSYVLGIAGSPCLSGRTENINS